MTEALLVVDMQNLFVDVGERRPAVLAEPHQLHGGGNLGSLAGLLRAAGTESVRVVGIAADVCVAATARDALRLGYPATIPLRATAFMHIHPDGDEATVAELRADGARVTG